MKSKTKYVCQSCGYESAKWLGRCSGCGDWNTLVEEQTIPSASKREEGLSDLIPSIDNRPSYVSLTPDKNDANGERERSASVFRLKTQIGELDRVLGGGLVPDSFTLVGGDPGIGKSTLLLQMADGLVKAKGQKQLKVLYVSGEESTDQIRRRANRLGIESQGQIFLAADTQLERVLATIKELKPDVVVMDSLQTFSTAVLQSAPGSVGQVREVASRLMTLAKSAGISVWLVGHVTKDGSIAGPKVVEHMVDTVLYFEGDQGQNYRLPPYS